MDELQYPIAVYTRAIERDAEGAGRRRGAPGTYVELGPLGCEMTVLYASDGSTFAPRGARGGHPGCLAWQERVHADGTAEPLPVYGEVLVAHGERIRCRTSGGGGYGDPREREVGAVAFDVREGWISSEKARSVYGVVCDHDGIVDMEATSAGRAEAAT
jgi:N-methylhydantoinase B